MTDTALIATLLCGYFVGACTMFGILSSRIENLSRLIVATLERINEVKK